VAEEKAEDEEMTYSANVLTAMRSTTQEYDFEYICAQCPQIKEDEVRKTLKILTDGGMITELSGKRFMKNRKYKTKQRCSWRV